MEYSGGRCCICLKKTHCVSLENEDSSKVKYVKKLVLCVPSEIWRLDYKICDLCTGQLDTAYNFIQICLDGIELRRKELDNLEKDASIRFITKEKCFTCNKCRQTFKQKSYLAQHISVFHISGDSVKEESIEIKVDEPGVNSEVKPESESFLSGSINKEDIERIKFENLDDNDDIENYEHHNNSDYSEESGIDGEFLIKPDKRSPKRQRVKKEPQKCDFCDKIFKKNQDWLRHIRTEHSFEKPFSCDQCDAKYMNRYSLLIHSRKHKNERPFICATCGKSFVSSADLNHHNKIHNQDRAYPCPVCDRSFKTHSNLRTHRMQMHLDPADWKYACDFCEKKFPIQGNLRKHLKRHAGIKEFDCHICDKQFINKAELTLHLNTHTNQRLFKCVLCSKDYKNREGLRRHMKVVHDLGNWKAPKVEKKYLCPMCPKIFAFGNKLQRHIFTHTGEKPFGCDLCPESFIDNYGRKVHLKKKHNMEIV